MGPEREIENLLYRYTEMIDAGDYAGLGHLFRHAKHTSGAGVEVNGASEIEQYYVNRTRRFPETGTPRTKHLNTNVIIEVDSSGTTASSRSYFTVFQAVPDVFALQPIIAGRYEDTFAVIDGEWQFTERRKYVDLRGDLREHLLWDNAG